MPYSELFKEVNLIIVVDIDVCLSADKPLAQTFE